MVLGFSHAVYSKDFVWREQTFAPGREYSGTLYASIRVLYLRQVLDISNARDKFITKWLLQAWVSNKSFDAFQNVDISHPRKKERKKS